MRRHREGRASVAFKSGVAALAAAGFLAMPGIAAAQDFTAEVSPNPVILMAGGDDATVTVTTQITPPFQNPITYSFTGFPAGISTGGSQVVVFPYNPASFTFAADANMARGSYTGSLVGTTPGGSQSFPMTVVVQRPDFSLSVVPASVSFSPGSSATVSVRVVPIDGFTGVVSVTAPSIAGIEFTPSSFDLGAMGSRMVTIHADPGAAPGTRSGTFRGTSNDVSGERTAALTIQVTEPPPPPPPPPAQDFSLTASPASLVLAPGESSVVTLSAAGIGGFDGEIMASVTFPPVLTVVPSSFTLSAGGSRAVTVTASQSVAPGTMSLAFAGMAAGIPGSRTATVDVTVSIPLSMPVIDAITPPSVVTGTTGNVLRITGQNFELGATIVSTSPGVTVTAARILGPGSAEVVVAVRPGAPAGPYRLDLTNPDGAIASGGAMLLVYPAGALSAPLAVTAAAIVAPRPWQILEPGQFLHAQALLATSGMGTVVGTWLLDGVPFDRFTRVVASGYAVEVRSSTPIPISFTGEHRLELVIESPQSLPPRGVPFFRAVESRSELKVLAPAPEATIDADAPFFHWTLVPGASGYEVEVQNAASEASDQRPRTAIRRRVTDTDWRPEERLLERLGPGEKRFRVLAVFPGEVAGEPTPWVIFTIPGRGSEADDADASRRQHAPFRLVSTIAASLDGRAPDTAGLEEGGSSGEFGLSLMSSTTTIASAFEDPPPLTRLQLSTQTDFRTPAFDQQATADLSGSHDLEDPWNARAESRNWLTRFGASQGGFREEFALGFAPPAFFDQTEFLTVATSSGALQATLGSPVGRLAYYRSVDLSANGSFSGFEPEIRAAAYEAGDEAGRFLFRTMLLDVTDPEVEDFSSGGDGRALGVIGVAQVRPWLRLLGEAAGGEFDPGDGGFEEARDGKAFRLAIDGAAGTFGYGFTLGRTGEGFVNPANRGFTPGGISDRTRAELSLQKYFGQAVLSGAYRHVHGGIHEAAGDPGTTENGAGVQLGLPLGERLALNLSGNIVGQRGDPIEDLGLPATDRTQKGADLSLTETVGAFHLTQSLTWQDFADQVQPLSDQTVTGLSLAANGGLASYLNLSANVSTTRTSAAPEIGTTNQLLLSLQPAITIDRIWLAITPRTAWTSAANDLDDSEFRSDQYQLVARWSPPWLATLLNLGIASDWNRNWSHFDSEPPAFDRQTVLTLTLNWRADHSWSREMSAIRQPADLALAVAGEM